MDKNVNFSSAIYHLIKKVSTTLPPDIKEAIFQARLQESGSAELALQIIEENLLLAKEKNTPLCQDTGFPTFFITAPSSANREEIENAVLSAVQKATEDGLLRPNAVDSLTGKNSGNIGKGFPKIVWGSTPLSPPCPGGDIRVQLLLKGGGSENVSAQVSLPMETDFGRAGRDRDGVVKAVLQIVKNAEGKGCAPGILGVHIGGDRESGYAYAKKNLLLPITEENEDEELKSIESEILQRGNELGIGPMGFGGKTTLLGVKCSVSHRVPASFFVTVSYGCWAMRRGEMVIDVGADLRVCPQNDVMADLSVCPDIPTSPIFPKNPITTITFPCKEEDVRSLKKGDIVLVNGEIFTGRDRLHEEVVKNGLRLPKDVSGSAVYHCGPVVIEEKTPPLAPPIRGDHYSWRITAAGPTTSIREEPYEGDFIAKTGIRAVIGKGGMGEKTKKALCKYGAVYLHAIGGAAAFYAQSIKEVVGVDFLEEFGIPEAMWHLQLTDDPRKGFLCVVTMDSHEEA